VVGLLLHAQGDAPGRVHSQRDGVDVAVGGQRAAGGGRIGIGIGIGIGAVALAASAAERGRSRRAGEASRRAGSQRCGDGRGLGGGRLAGLVCCAVRLEGLSSSP
jgi:hypothetical protein